MAREQPLAYIGDRHFFGEASLVGQPFLFVRTPDFGASFEVAESLLAVGQVGYVLKRSVLLSIRVVSSVVLIGLREGVHDVRPDFLSRTP